MTELHQYTRVDFHRFKAFRSFTLALRHFNIMVGPNNAGKSTILAAFRILASALRRAEAKRATVVHGPLGPTMGYAVDLDLISVAEENIFYDYDDDEAATVKFTLSNGHTLTLYFPEAGACYLLPDARGKSFDTPKAFRAAFNCPIGFVPILGPVEHHEQLYQKEAARLALFNYRAARNFRNIWYHYPEKFQEFRDAVKRSWPGMDIERPEVDTSHTPPRLQMFCPEERKPREIFWSGFGFQVWCQMLTHLIQWRDVSLFLIDEPDIYLHSELQRQLLGLLRGLGPDVLIATHSTEIITDAEADDILLVSKKRKAASRIKNPSELEAVFNLLGSNINPILTQLAKTRRVVFVEGKDYQILSRFAQRLGASSVGNRSNFAVVPVDGFNPERIRNLKAGMETTLGTSVLAAAVLDRDYRSEAECATIVSACEAFCDRVTIHGRKEIENFLLVPAAIDRAAARRVAERTKRSGTSGVYDASALALLEQFADEKRSYVTAQYLSLARPFYRVSDPKLDEASINEIVLNQLDGLWADRESRLGLVGGKEALAALNTALQKACGITVTATAIIEAMHVGEIPEEISSLIELLTEFGAKQPTIIKEAA